MNRPSPISTKPSRRGFLAVLSAGTASAVVPAALAAPLAPVTETALSDLAPAVAGPSPDAALLKLIDDYRVAKAETDRAHDVFAPFEEKSFARKRQLLAQMPEALRALPEDVALELPISATDGFYGLHIEKREGHPLFGRRHLGTVGTMRGFLPLPITVMESPAPGAGISLALRPSASEMRRPEP
jgi:hypothetical protein